MNRVTTTAFLFFILLTNLQLQAQTKKPSRQYVSPDPLYKYNIDSAYSLLDNEKYKEAIPFLQAALNITDKSYATELKLANAYNKTLQPDNCFGVLEQLCKKHWNMLNTLIQQQGELATFMFANLFADKRWAGIVLCVKQKQTAYNTSKDSADMLMKEEKYKAAIPYLQTVVETGDDTHLYETQLAIAYNKTEQSAACFNLLNKMANDWDWMESYMANDTGADFAFANLVHYKPWMDLKLRVDSIATAQTIGHNRKLMAELKEIMYTDQLYRNMNLIKSNPINTQRRIDSIWALQDRVDSLNLLNVIDIFDKYGYPGDSLVGSNYSSVGWLVIQHADLKYQEKYLSLIKAAADKRQLPWADVALLIDRIEMYNKRPQIYGSQITCDLDRKCTIYKILDEANVNKLRAEVGLGPLQDYVSQWGIKWSPPQGH